MKVPKNVCVCECFLHLDTYELKKIETFSFAYFLGGLLACIFCQTETPHQFNGKTWDKCFFAASSSSSSCEGKLRLLLLPFRLCLIRNRLNEVCTAIIGD